VQPNYTISHRHEHGEPENMADSKARLDRGLEARFLSNSRTRESAPAEAEAAGNQSRLEMKWIVVTENGKRQLRMQWSVRADAATQAFETSAGKPVNSERLSKRSAAI